MCVCVCDSLSRTFFLFLLLLCSFLPPSSFSSFVLIEILCVCVCVCVCVCLCLCVCNQGINFVPQQEAWVVERFGRFYRVLEPVRSAACAHEHLLHVD